jgi:hypothetical protein
MLIHKLRGNLDGLRDTSYKILLRNHLEDQERYGRVTLRWILEKEVMRVRDGWDSGLYLMAYYDIKGVKSSATEIINNELPILYNKFLLSIINS